MSRLKKNAGKKAVMLTLRHSSRGFWSKARREPLRTGTLLGAGGAAGAAAGAAAGFLVGRKSN
jgi:hypothetical protein